MCSVVQEVLGTALVTLLQVRDWTMSQIPRCLESSVRLLLCQPIFYVVFYNIHVLYIINKSFWLLKSSHPNPSESVR